MKTNSTVIRFRSPFAHRRVMIFSLLGVLALALLVCSVVVFAEDSWDEPDPQAPKVSEGSFLVYLSVDGETYSEVFSEEEGGTVESLLARRQISLNPEDIMNYSPDQRLTPELRVEILRVTYRETTSRESIPYETQQMMMTFSLSPVVKDKYRPRLKDVAGVPGIREIVTREKLVDGQVVSSSVVSSTVVSEPVDAVVHVDATHLLNLADGPPTTYVDKRSFEFTAYTYDEEGPSNTASGEWVRVGYVAVDRSVIPLHSYLYIVLDNGFVYGYCYAKDVGSAIKGNIIDVFLPCEIDCYWFGRRQGTVYIINYGS
jgi:3D (Asp-Asp-Asp) domain-containing protein